MKTVLMVLSDHFSIRNFLYSPFLEQHSEYKGYQIVFALKNADSHQKAVANFENIILEEIDDPDISRTSRIKAKIIENLYKTLVYRFYKINKLKNLEIKQNIPKNHLISREEDHFKLYARYPCPDSKKLFNQLLRIYNIPFFYSRRALDVTGKHSPSLVVLTNPHNTISRNYAIAAKIKKIPVFSYITSWDFLTTKGPVFDSIEKFITWNTQMRDELIKLHGFKGPIEIAGPLQMDFTFKHGALWSKEETFEYFKIDPNKKIIVFGVYNERFGSHEPGILKHFIEKTFAGRSDVWIIVRGHPHDETFKKRYGFAEKSGIVTLNQGYRFNSYKLDQADDRVILNSMLEHADLVICGPTTLTLDALRFDKPVINIGFDGDLALPKEASIAARYETAHYAPLLSFSGIDYVENYQELDSAILQALAYPEKLAANRKKIVEYYLEPLDGKACERMHEIIRNGLINA
jgi:hypothetical protein